jgi:hypothetical protein
MADKYENIAVLPDVKKRFLKRYTQAKKKSNERHFYMSDYLDTLLDLEEQK